VGFFIALNAQTQERILFLGRPSIDNWQTIKADFPRFDAVEKG
jgi:hypothetical protein